MNKEASSNADNITINPLIGYSFIERESQPEEDHSVTTRLRRLEDQFDESGFRRSVEAVMVVEFHGFPHVLVLQVANAFYKLPGGYIDPSESDSKGLITRLNEQLGVPTSTRHTYPPPPLVWSAESIFKADLHNKLTLLSLAKPKEGDGKKGKINIIPAGSDKAAEAANQDKKADHHDKKTDNIDKKANNNDNKANNNDKNGNNNDKKADNETAKDKDTKADKDSKDYKVPTGKGGDPLWIIPAGGEDWRVSHCLSTWWRPNFDTFFYPYIPAHISKPKECKKLYLVTLPPKKTFAVPVNMKLHAIPIYEFYDNAPRYGPQFAGIPYILSKYDFVKPGCTRDEKKDKNTDAPRKQSGVV